MIFRLELGKQTAPGLNRSQNEDNIGYYFPQQPEVLLLRGQMFMVTDGNGEAGLGGFASKLAVQTVIQEYYEEPWVGTVEEMLTKSFMKANRTLIDANIENRSTTRFSASLTCGVINQENLYLAHIGTCSAFLLSYNLFEILTQSHSIDVEKSDRDFDIQGEENGKVLVRALGIDEDIKVDIFKRKIQINDLIVLCTDGVYNFIDEKEIQNIIAAAPPQPACELIVEQARANETPDDATAMVIKVISIKRVEADEPPPTTFVDQSEPSERQIVIKGVRYRSTWKEQPLPPEEKQTVVDFSQDRGVRRPIIKRTKTDGWKPSHSIRQLFNIITIIAFIALITVLAIKYVPNYLKSRRTTNESKIVTDSLSQVAEPKLPSDEQNKEAEIAPIAQPDINELEDTTEYLTEQVPTVATAIGFNVVIIDGSFKQNLKWDTFIEGMKLFSNEDQINNIKSSLRLQKSKILWRRSDNTEKENMIKQRIDQYQRLYAQYFNITPEISPFDLTLLIGSNFKLPRLQTSYSEVQIGNNGDYYLEILNGFTVPGLARRSTEQLNNRKMNEKRLVVVDYRNADRKNYRVSFIKCDPSLNNFSKELASLLEQRLPVINTQLFDIKLIIGTDIQF
jgi:serine/threonine protein phosphatase PrpC